MWKSLNSLFKEATDMFNLFTGYADYSETFQKTKIKQAALIKDCKFQFALENKQKNSIVSYS